MGAPDDTAKSADADEPTAGVSPIVMDELFDRIIEVAQNRDCDFDGGTERKTGTVTSPTKALYLFRDATATRIHGQALLADQDVRKAFLGG